MLFSYDKKPKQKLQFIIKMSLFNKTSDILIGLSIA